MLQELEYKGFRNLIDRRLEFSEHFNLFTGANGAGKTNLLEAIFFSAYATSFRTNEERNLLKFNEPFLRVEARSERNEASVFYNGEKKVFLGGNERHRLVEFIGWIQITVMSLDDIWIIRGAPSKRRAFLDWLISKFNLNYAFNLSEYRRILRQRNSLLRKANEGVDLELLDVLNEQIVHYGNELYKERARILPKLKEKIAEIGESLGINQLNIDYHTSCPEMCLNIDLLKERESDDLRLGETTVGPHRDDFSIVGNRYPLKNFASEGEIRLSALALKITEAKLLQEKSGEKPILLLDEVASELDERRKTMLFKNLEGQIFYATVREDNYIKKLTTKRFSVQEGRIEAT